MVAFTVCSFLIFVVSLTCTSGSLFFSECAVVNAQLSMVNELSVIPYSPLPIHHSHGEHFILLIQKLIFDHFLPRLGLFKFFQFLVKTLALFDNGHPGTTYKFDESIGRQYFYQFIRFLAVTTGFKNGIVFPDHNGSGTMLAKQSFYFYFFGYLIRRYFIQSQFLPNNFIIVIIVSFQHFYLLLYLAGQFAYHIFGFVDHDRKTVNAFCF
eukprot:Opistho-1_new@83831